MNITKRKVNRERDVRSVESGGENRKGVREHTVSSLSQVSTYVSRRLRGTEIKAPYFLLLI